jgi:hypothetical protein
MQTARPTMKMLHVLAVVVLLGAGASPAAAQISLDFQDGKVRLRAQSVSVSQILAEWARRGRTTIVNGERVPGPAVTIELQDVSEQTALDVLLRGVSGYLVAPRETSVAGASSFDRIYILPTSSRPTNAAALPPQQAQQQIREDFDDDEALVGPRGVNPGVNPGARLPREITQPGVAARPGTPPIDAEQEPDAPEARPQPSPGNPFGVQPGSTRPGVITPGPTTTRPRDQ